MASFLDALSVTNILLGIITGLIFIAILIFAGAGWTFTAG